MHLCQVPNSTTTGTLVRTKEQIINEKVNKDTRFYMVQKNACVHRAVKILLVLENNIMVTMFWWLLNLLYINNVKP